MTSISLLSVIPLYAAVLGLIFIPLTLRVGMYRIKNKVDIGDAGDKELLRRIRCQANFVETVPIALALLICMELMGASSTWLHSLGGLLVAARVAHFLGLSRLGPFALRPAGMIGTFLTYLLSAGWILAQLV
jgi:uncharacterized membrane protein YecN with MAPEG domain